MSERLEFRSGTFWGYPRWIPKWFLRWWTRVPQWAQPTSYYAIAFIRIESGERSEWGQSREEVWTHGSFFDQRRALEAFGEWAWQHMRLRPGERERTLWEWQVHAFRGTRGRMVYPPRVRFL